MDTDWDTFRNGQKETYRNSAVMVFISQNTARLRSSNKVIYSLILLGKGIIKTCKEVIKVMLMIYAFWDYNSS